MKLPENLLSGAVRGLLSVGGWARLIDWARDTDGRKLNLSLSYTKARVACWHMTITDSMGHVRYDGTGPTLEVVCIEAVAALGVH
jgi:hypothetical protein